ncbi:MAG: DapH/DapD/GlmU-related protein [Cyanobacteria bacterium J06636_27]
MACCLPRWQKHRTIIGNNTGTGCNSVLIAPITVGDNAYVAAGSSFVTDDGAMFLNTVVVGCNRTTANI